MLSGEGCKVAAFQSLGARYAMHEISVPQSKGSITAQFFILVAYSTFGTCVYYTKVR